MPEVPDPDKEPLGVPVTVQEPLAGKLFNCTLPVPTKQVGCVTVPMVGAEGIGFTVAVTCVRGLLVQVPTVAATQ